MSIYESLSRSLNQAIKYMKGNTNMDNLVNHECKDMYVSIYCDDRAEKIEFMRTIWDDGEEWFSFSFKDSYIGEREDHGLLGRFRRAWQAFCKKPIIWADVMITDRSRVESFLQRCHDIMEKEVEE